MRKKDIQKVGPGDKVPKSRERLNRMSTLTGFHKTLEQQAEKWGHWYKRNTRGTKNLEDS